MAKETRLDDSADIYQRRDKQTEKQKMSEMTFQEKVTYFNQYYRLKVIIIVGMLAFAIYFLYTIFSPKVETVFYAAISDNYLDEEKKAEFSQDFEKYLNLDPKKNKITLDTSYVLGTENTISGESVASSQEKISTYTYAQQIDVIIAPEESFRAFAKLGYFDDLADQLPTDLYSHFADSLLLEQQEEDTEKKAYGIYLTDCKNFQDMGNIVDKPVLGIVSNSKYKNNSIDFIKYIFQLY